MLPVQLKTTSFAGYAPEGRRHANDQLALLQQLPPILVPILLRELIAYDWKFPAERRELNRQFQFLSGLSDAKRAVVMEGFRALSLGPELAATDWVNNPSGYMEKLTASLWSTHQMDRFREVAEAYAAAVNASLPAPNPAMPRLGIVVIGAEAKASTQPLFRKLRPAGVHLTRVVPDDGLAILLAEASRRATIISETRPYGGVADTKYLHWYIEGGSANPTAHLAHISYARLERPRGLLLGRIQRAIGSGDMGPEELRSLLARLKPDEVGFGGDGSDPVLDRFQLSLLTEGAGTQIFATTFAQWATRECVRRAEPETLLVRYAPRQQAQPLNAMLSGGKPIATDPTGSLIDADIGAYYTWINMRRLTGADQLRFIVWFEDHREALVIGPNLPRGTSSDSLLDMHRVLSLLQA